MRFPVFLAALLAAQFSAPLCAPAWAAGDTGSSDPSMAERLETARKSIDTKNWRRAKSDLEAALKEEPRNADVYNLLGYYNRKKPSPDLPKAFEYYNTALKLNPDHRGAHEYIGEAFLMDNNPQEAEKHLTQLARICGGTQCEEYQDLAKSLAAYQARKK